MKVNIVPEKVPSPISDSSSQKIKDVESEPETPVSEESGDIQVPETNISQKTVGTEFLILPIPKRLQYRAETPFQFSYALTMVYASATMIIVGNLYYCQPLLIEMAKSFGVSYDRVAKIPTCVQAGYAVGLFVICPLGDIVRRRQLVLGLIACTTLLTIGLAVTKNVVLFEALCTIVGVFNVVLQILIPLVSETAPKEIHAFAFSIVLTGLMFGILLARIIAGIIAQFVAWRIVYFVAVGLQALVLAGLYFSIPDHPVKDRNTPYWRIHWTMAVLVATEPVVVQVVMLNIGASACFACFWVTLTFLLGGNPYNYSTLEIGLFGLIGLAGVAAGPISGRIVDRLTPWHSLLGSTILLLGFQSIQTAAGATQISALVVSCFGIDFLQQIQNVSLATYIFSVSKPKVSRLNAIYMISFYLGQIIGTSTGTKLFLRYGWIASASFGMGLYVMQILILLVRGPHCAQYKWFGYEGGVGLGGRTVVV